METSLEYRRDIDGMRAIAVLAVIGYHAFPRWVPGGFVGVDVFFVISGFLITGILLARQRTDGFSFAWFYTRRVRRLFPALVVVLGACLAAGWLLLFPDEYRQLSRHAFFGSAFTANIAIWRNTGYFDNAAELKPLLHLWSLGVEEQFYLLWPVLLSLAAWRGIRAGYVVLVVSVCSFVINVRLAGSPADFFLPFSRFWELLAGAALACTVARPPLASSIRRFGSWGGIALLVAGFALIGPRAHFPGYWAVLPVGGSALLIASGPESFIARTVLSTRWLVNIGLISYPLYLWHWPLLSFARIVSGGEISVALRIVLILTSGVLAFATYRWLERPFRSRPANGRTTRMLCGALAIVAAAGLLVVRRQGFANRFGAEAADLVYAPEALGRTPCDPALRDHEPRLTYCVQSGPHGPPEYAVFGDSHADHLFTGITSIDHEHTWLLAGHPSCPPVLGIRVFVDQPECEARSERVLDYLVASPSVHTVVLTYFSGYVQDTWFAADHMLSFAAKGPPVIESSTFGTKRELFYSGLDATISALEHAGKHVVLVEDVPELPFFPRDCLARSSLLAPARAECSLSREAVEQRQQLPRRIVADLAKAHPALRVFDPLPTLCTEQTCPAEAAGHLLYCDSHHLSSYGAALIAQQFLPWFAAQTW